MGLSKILADSENNDSDKKKLETAEMLHNSSKKLYAFLENLLNWARVQRGEIEYKPEEHNLFEIAAEVIYLFKPKAEQNGVIIKNYINEDTTVFCDSNMINTILRNLVSNAINFTEKYGMVTIDAIVRKDEVTILVSDTGVGISQANMKKLLKIDSKHIGTNVSGEKGTGLGLILCKEFVEKHNGKIWIESEFGKGSKFYFTIPIINY
jgi:signal transduction histidine kinase